MTLSKVSPYIDIDTKAVIKPSLVVKEDENEDLSESASDQSEKQSPELEKEVKFEKVEKFN